MAYNQAARAAGIISWDQRRPKLADVKTNRFPQLWSAGAAVSTGSQGQILSCLSTGQWLGASPLQITRQWFRNDASVANATHASFSVSAADSGRVIFCRCFASNRYSVSYADSAQLQILA